MKLPFFITSLLLPFPPSYTYNNNNKIKNMKKGSILSSTKTLLFCSIFLVLLLLLCCSLLLLLVFNSLWNTLSHSLTLFWDIIIINVFWLSSEPYHQRCVMLFVCCYALSIHKHLLIKCLKFFFMDLSFYSTRLVTLPFVKYSGDKFEGYFELLCNHLHLLFLSTIYVTI